MIDRKYFDEQLKAKDEFINHHLKIIRENIKLVSTKESDPSDHSALLKLVDNLESYQNSSSRLEEESSFRQLLFSIKIQIEKNILPSDISELILKSIAESFSTSVDEELISIEKKESAKKNNIAGLLKEIKTYTTNLQDDMGKLSTFFTKLADTATLLIVDSNPSSPALEALKGSPKTFLRPGITATVNTPPGSFKPLTFRTDSSESIASLPRAISIARMAPLGVKPAQGQDSPKPISESLVKTPKPRGKIRLIKEEAAAAAAAASPLLPGTPDPVAEESSFPFSERKKERRPSQLDSTYSSFSDSSDEMIDSLSSRSDSPTDLLPSQLAEFLCEAEDIFSQFSSACNTIFSQQPASSEPLNKQLRALCDEFESENFSQFTQSVIRASRAYLFLHSFMDGVISPAYPELLKNLALSSNFDILEFNNKLAKSFQCLMRYELLLKEIVKNTPKDLSPSDAKHLHQVCEKISGAVKESNEENQKDALTSFRPNIENLVLTLELERKKLIHEITHSPSGRKTRISHTTQRLALVNDLITNILSDLKQNTDIDTLLNNMQKIIRLTPSSETSPLERRGMFTSIRSASTVATAIKQFEAQTLETKTQLTKKEGPEQAKPGV